MTKTHTLRQAQPEALLTRKEISSKLKVSVRTICRWEAAGKLNPIFLTPRTIRFRIGDVEKLLQGAAS